MTEQSPNDIFHASSFMQGHNAEYLEQLQARWANDPASVDAAWADFFKQLGASGQDAQAEATGPSWARLDWPPVPNDDLTAALDGQWPVEAKAAGDKIRAKAAEAGVSVSDDQIKQAVAAHLKNPDAAKNEHVADAFSIAICHAIMADSPAVEAIEAAR